MLLLPKHFLLLSAFSLLTFTVFAGTVTGTVLDEKGAPLPFSSITVKNTSNGVMANSFGLYTISLPAGDYTLVCQHVGYKTAEKKITVNSIDQQVNFVLPLQDLAMAEVVIRRGQDPALEIMRQAIKKREEYNRQVDSFTVEVYIKGLIRSRAIPDRVLGKKIDKSGLGKQGIDSSGKGILFLSESVTKVAFKRPDKIKLEVLSSRQSGGGFGISVPFFVNFYTNNVRLLSGNFNPRGFVSPLADGAFHFYNFRYEGNFFEGDKMIDRIRVTPKRRHEPLFDGFVQIVDGEWRLHSVSLSVTKSQGLDMLDTVRITQAHAGVTANVWRTQNQVIYFSANMFGFDIAGDFLNVYSNYNLDPGFKKKYFDRVIIKYDSSFNKRDTAYWTSRRPVPLEPDEKLDFILKDSVSKAERDSMFTRRHIDSLRKAQKPVKVHEAFLNGITRNYYSTESWKSYHFAPLLKGLQYNTVEGVSLSVQQSVSVRPRQGNTDYEIGWNSRYGFANSHFNSYGTFTLKPKEESYRNRFLSFSGGKIIQQFNRANPIDEFTNSISTLFYRRNFLKLYEAWFGRVEYNTSFESGLRLNVTANVEDRIPVKNRADFSFSRKEKMLLPNHPHELAAVPFKPHNAAVAALTLSYQPGQRYIELPRRKIPIGSEFPTLELQYTKGLPQLFNSTADFDKWKFSVYDDANLKLAGTVKYKVSIGGFLNRRSVDIPDFQHFIGNQILFNYHYLNSFQLAPYYRYSNTERLYGLVHAEHHFNGLLTNKIPLLNRLKWNLVAGTNAFYVNGNNYYAEMFAGLENIFKIFRVDFVTAVQAAGGKEFGIRLGFGGIIGSSVRMGQ